ncbi:hypothetical protein U8607_04990 [Methylobacterium durans]|uniref:hypothetical protein n=1 Tax=Methylobacterium durans TaxID=2202825 RepID=UPI002AFF2FA1|nr:hypothetical protein [Methylobacterium durans]MEA1831433.1 hypothetical protein [Methylobacterium durans]
MPLESCITPDETAALAAAARAQIDAALTGHPSTDREAYWASVRKAYNTPYNDPPPRKRPAAIEIPAAPPELPAPAVIAALGAPPAEIHAP